MPSLYDLEEVTDRFRLDETAFRDLRAEVSAGFKVGKHWMFEEIGIRINIDHCQRNTFEGLATSGQVPELDNELQGRPFGSKT